jgi:hypothetical protein
VKMDATLLTYLMGKRDGWCRFDTRTHLSILKYIFPSGLQTEYGKFKVAEKYMVTIYREF